MLSGDATPSKQATSTIMHCFVMSAPYELFVSFQPGRRELQAAHLTTASEVLALVLVGHSFALRTYAQPHMYLACDAQGNACFTPDLTPASQFHMQRPEGPGDLVALCGFAAPGAGKLFLQLRDDNSLGFASGCDANSSLEFVRIKDAQLLSLPDIETAPETLAQAFGRRASADELIEKMSTEIDDSEPLVMTETEKQRQYSIMEVIRSEQRYFRHISELADPYASALLTDFTAEQHEDLFGSVAQIVKISDSMNQALAKREKKHADGVRLFGDIFLCHSQAIRSCYINQSRTLHSAIALLGDKTAADPAFEDTLEELGGGLGHLKSLLRRPMERVEEYRKLVKEIQLYTLTGHPDRDYIDRALSEVSNLAATLKLTASSSKSDKAVAELQKNLDYGDFQPAFQLFVSARKLEHEAEVQKYPTTKLQATMRKTLRKTMKGKFREKAVTDVTILVFTDLLLLVRKTKAKKGPVKMVLVAEPMLFKDVSVDDSGADSLDGDLFQLVHSEQCYLFKAANTMQCAQWVRLLQHKVQSDSACTPRHEASALLF